ncbi:hypothetical protein HMPREF9440_01407 [Sutterella parvirubra YIT 11816]|uniref:Uncharacterized protein n=1 Tax=Sutterella parvirubra YIT 11816 TaxID=762967 RepID=H3KF90_9BURK|nr:hypothetical protein HMPREF9440_01407 [Sutterella parvirubra YIT 11816]
MRGGNAGFARSLPFSESGPINDPPQRSCGAYRTPTKGGSPP